MTKLIIFDWDDVFTFGSTDAYIACYHQALLEVGIELSPTEEIKRIKAKWGATVREEVAELLQERPDLVETATDRYEQILMGDTFVKHLTFVDGGNELLDRLSQKYTLAIASGINPKLLKEKVFPKFDVQNVFSEIVTVYDLDDPSHAKPHPYLLQEILRRLTIEPGEAIMVGDAAGDVKMALAAGIRPVVVLTGHLDRSQAEAFGVKDIIPTVSDLEQVL